MNKPKAPLCVQCQKKLKVFKLMPFKEVAYLCLWAPCPNYGVLQAPVLFKKGGEK